MRLRSVFVNLLVLLASSSTWAPTAAARTFGTDAELTVAAVAPDGRWVAWCEVPVSTGMVRGGEPLPVLVASNRGSGWSVRLDRLLAVDPSGRWLVGEQGRSLVLLDLDRRRQELLAEFSEAVPDWPGGVATFDLASRRLLYLRGDTLVLRDLATGGETVLPESGPSQLDPGGEWVWSWPTDQPPRRGVATDSGPYTCDAPLRVGEAPPPAARVGARILALRSPEQVIDAARVITPLGDGLLFQAEYGALTCKHGSEERVLVPAACHGRVRQVEPGTDTALVTCAGGTDLLAVSPAGSFSLKLALEPDAGGQAAPETLDRYLWAPPFLVDGRTHAVVPIPPKGYAVSIHDGNVLFFVERPGGTFARWREASGRTIEGDVPLEAYSPLVAGRWAVVARHREPTVPEGRWGVPPLENRPTDSILFDLADGSSRPVHGIAAALTDDGRVLLYATPWNGPLAWEARR